MPKQGRKLSPAANDRHGPPYVGALLRMTYEVARRRVFKALMERGLTDLNPALLNVFVYPPPDGVGPTELADRLNMTKQALNYLLGQLEALGYIERRVGKGSRRPVFLTRRGWQILETHREALRALEDEWSAILGAREFEDFVDALRRLSSPGSDESSAHFQRRRGSKTGGNSKDGCQFRARSAQERRHLMLPFLLPCRSCSAQMRERSEANRTRHGRH